MNDAKNKTAKPDSMTAVFILPGGGRDSCTMTGFSSGYTIGEFVEFIRHCWPGARDIEIKPTYGRKI